MSARSSLHDSPVAVSDPERLAGEKPFLEYAGGLLRRDFMSYDFDLFVIGAGSGGVRAARFAAGFGAKVAVAESRYLGGTCVNVGCVPKKLLVYGAHYAEELADARGYGWSLEEARFDWPTLIANKNREIQRLNDIYRRLLLDSGVTLLEGHARLCDPHTVEIDGKRYSAAHILVATGGWPQIPDIPGHEHAISSNEAFYLKELPKRILVVGGGYIAVEFASIFHSMGAQLTLLYRRELFLRGFDTAIREHLRDELLKKGMDLQFNADIVRIDKQRDGSLHATLKDGRVLETDCVFYATGRRPMLDNLGLENLDVKLDQRGFIEVDELYRTSVPSVLAIGDVTGRVQLTPVALAEGMAVARRLFKPEEYRRVDYQQIPTAIFSLPNAATVGMTEEQAREAGHRVDIYESRFRPLKLSLTENLERSLMKLVVDADSDRVLGCHMVGPDAGEIIQGLAVALKAGATKRVFDETLGIHPTAAEEFVTMRTSLAT
jgi:glutathione reductase (NADPH)